MEVWARMILVLGEAEVLDQTQTSEYFLSEYWWEDESMAQPLRRRVLCLSIARMASDRYISVLIPHKQDKLLLYDFWSGLLRLRSRCDYYDVFSEDRCSVFSLKVKVTGYARRTNTRAKLFPHLSQVNGFSAECVR